MRRILRPFPWALLGHLCLGIVLAPLLAILLGLTAVALPLAVFTPRPFLSLVRGLGSLAGLDRARFDVLARRHVGQPLPAPPSRSTGSADARRAARQAGGCGGGMTPIWRIAPTSSRTPQCSASRSPSVR